MATLNLSWWQSWYLNVDPQPISSVLDDHNIPFKREQRSGTLTIVDWDDTLFPTSSLRWEGVDVRREDVDDVDDAGRARLKRVEREAVALLRAAQKHNGYVKIVTVASESWVWDVSARLMPRLRQYIRDAGIEVQSARDDYQAHAPDDPHTWKYWAFKHQLDKCYPDSQDLDCIVVGDGSPERYAARQVAAENPDIAVKLVRFTAVSTLNQLATQLGFTQRAFYDIEVNFDSVEIGFEFD